jgi:hypothetical protein
MDQVTRVDWPVAETDASTNGRADSSVLEGVLGQAEVARLMEGDRKPKDMRPNVFIDVRRIADVLLPVGQAGYSRAFVAHLGEEVGLRIPELVTLGFDSMPAEPPVNHLTSRARKPCENRDVTGPIREICVTSFK